MTSLVLGAAGGIIGGIIGGPVGAQIGFLAGSLIGNLLDPPKVQGPRLGELKLQHSTYGAPIPFCWGKGRLAGNVIDQTDLKEHEEKSGGKGGPQVTNYTYSASFAVALCAKTPNRTSAILGVTRIWANGRLIWDRDNPSEDGGQIPCTVYLGTEDQLPDPTFEAIHGVGSQPAYRGTAYVVFTDYFLADFGNAIPQLEFEVYTNVGGTIPYRLYTWSFVSKINAAIAAAGLTDTAGGQPMITYDHGVITVSMPGVSTYVGIDQRTTNIYTLHFDIQGNVIGDLQSANTYGIFAAPFNYACGITTINDAGTPKNYQLVKDEGGGWILGPEFIESSPGWSVGGGYPTYPGGNDNAWQNDRLYGASSTSASNCVLNWRPAPGGAIADVFGGASPVLAPGIAGSMAIGTSNTGHIYAMQGRDGIGGCYLWEMDEDLNLIRSWSPSQTTTTWLGQHSGANFHVVDDMIVSTTTAGAGQTRLTVTRIMPDGSLANPSNSVALVTTGGPRLASLFGGFGIDYEGVYCINPPNDTVKLSEIVADVTAMTPLGSNANVSELTDDVRWFVMANQMSARNAIDSLRKVFFFDAVESDDTVKHRKRGAASVASIPDVDLLARDLGSAPGEPLLTSRRREQELPRRVTLTYIDVDAAYQTGAQSSIRQVTQSQSDTTLEVPVGFTAEEAAQKVLAVHSAEWVERESFEWSTSRKYAHLEPCDVVVIQNRTIRIQSRNESPSGVVKWTGVLSAGSAVYTQTQSSGSSGGGGNTTTPPGAKAATQLYFLDIPLISQDDSVFGFYAAMGPADSGRWAGAQLFKSLDGGVTYSAVASTNVAATTGSTSIGIGSPVETGTLPDTTYTGIVNEVSILVVMDRAGLTLESVTNAALTNGANLCAISIGGVGSPPDQDWEICQFRDAVLVSENIYRLTGFLRGLKGSDAAGHSNYDKFVLLPVTNVSAPQSDLNRTLTYKPVTSGAPLADAVAQDFYNSGKGAASYGGTVIVVTPPFTGPGTGSPSVAGTPGLVPAPGIGDDGKFLRVDGWKFPLIVQDEGIAQGVVATLNVVGSAGSISVAGSVATLSLSGAGSPDATGGTISVKDEGSVVAAAATSLDFVGPDVIVSAVGSAVTVRIDSSSLGSPSPSPAIAVQDEGILISSAVTNLNFVGPDVIVTGSGTSLTVRVDSRSLGSPSAGNGTFQSTEFSASGTFTTNSGVTGLWLTMIGGGGGGSGGSTAAQSGFGGGSGETVVALFVPASGNTAYTVTIGAGGAGSTGNVAATDGGQTSFDVYAVAGGRGAGTRLLTSAGDGGGPKGGTGPARGNPGQVGVTGTQESAIHFGGSSGGGGTTVTSNAGGTGGSSGPNLGGAGGATAASQGGGGGGAASIWGVGGAGGNGGAAGSAATKNGAGGGGGGGAAALTAGAAGFHGYCLIQWIS